MNLISEFLITLLTAAIMQNVIFTRGLGSCKETLMMSSGKVILRFGGLTTVILFLSSLLAWPLSQLLRRSQISTRFGIRYPIAIVSLICICIVFVLIYCISKAYLPKIHYFLKDLFVPAAFNCAVLGAMVIASSNSYGFLRTLGFALGSGIGYTLALLLIHEGRQRMELIDIPRSFRGMPVTLLYIGMLSLAIYGLIGHQLPT